MRCLRAACSGTIVDGYCDECGLAPAKGDGATHPTRPTHSSTTVLPPPRQPATTAATTAGPTTGTATNATSTTTTTTATVSSRPRLGAGLVHLPAIPQRDPASAVLVDPTVAENRRFCSGPRCDQPVGRSRNGRPGRTDGFCPSCGAPFSFVPKLCRGDTVSGQYEVVGCLAHGGLGWIYLARDRKVSDRWVVLKGLLNSSDEHAMAAALAERRFLAEVEHPNIVKIHNFVEHDGDGYIVMEYVNGVSLRALLEARRAANADRPDPLPVQEAIAYCLQILPALGHLHDLGLLFCDFKPDNVMHTGTSVKLIDLGGVYRVGDTADTWGTNGYKAPEIGDIGPSVASDLYTVGRTLAVLCTDFRGFRNTYEHGLPPAADVPLYEEFDSLYTLLQRATAFRPDDRFQSADEMASQLTGVLHEVVAIERNRPAPGTSTMFTGPSLAAHDRPEWSTLPAPLVNPDDPRAGVLLALASSDSNEIIRQLSDDPARTIETDLFLARALIDAGRLDEAGALVSRLEAADPWEWRVWWYEAMRALAAADPATARRSLRRVYATLPGELAVKLAIGMADEASGDFGGAGHWYDVVSRTDPSFTAATFGLARCRAELDDREGAIKAYDRVPDTAREFVDAKVAQADLLLTSDRPVQAANLLKAAQIVERVPLHRDQRARLSVSVFASALRFVQASSTNGEASTWDPSVLVLGQSLDEPNVRRGLEGSLRELARYAATPAERIALVDQANQVRPRSLW